MRIRSVKFNFIMNALLSLSSVIFPLITFPYISRVLGLANNGKVAFATSVVTYFIMFANLGIPTYGIRACAKVRDNKEKLSKVTQELLILNGITTIITIIAFVIAINIIPKFAVEKPLFLVTGLGIILNSLTVSWLYNALEQYSYITICSVAFKFIGIIMMFAMVRSPKDYIIYGFISTIASFGSGILNFINLRRYISFKKIGKYDIKEHIRPMLVFFALVAATSIYINLDIVMLGFMKDDSEVGYYNAAVKIKTVLTQLVTSLGAVLMPRLSYYIAQDNLIAFRKMVAKALNFVLLSAGSFSLFFIIYAKDSILLLSGKEFLGAVLPMQILMPTVLLIGISNVTGIQILTPTGREKEVLYSVVAGAILNLSLNAILIPKIASKGAAFSTLLAELVVVMLQAYFLRDVMESIFRQVEFGKIIGALLGAGLIGFILKAIISINPFMNLLVAGIAFYAIYIAILLLFKEKMINEIFLSLGNKIKRN